MNMNRMILIISLTLIGVVLSGCVGNTLTGTYVSENDSNTYLTFYADGTYVGFDNGTGVSGTYKVEENTVIVSVLGMAGKGDITENGKAVIFNNITYIKK
jgi:hypothetical protein